MTKKTIWANDGPHYYLDGQEVTKAQFDSAFPGQGITPGEPPGYMGTSRLHPAYRSHALQSQYQDRHPVETQILLDAAKKAGVSTQGKWFNPQLCRTGNPTDPQAWVGSDDETKALCKHRGWDCESKGGVLHVKTGGYAKPKKKEKK